MNALSKNVTVEPYSLRYPVVGARCKARAMLSETSGFIQTRTFTLLLFFVLLAAAPAVLLADGGTVDPGTTYQFTSTDNCGCSGTPFHDGPLRGTTSSCDLEQNRAEAAAMLSISAVNLNVSAFDALHTCFYVPGTTPTVLNATVSAKIEWDGVLFGAGVLGAGASVAVDLYLVDDTDGVIKASTRIMQKSQDSTGLKGIDVGGTHVYGSNAVSMQGTVVRGHEYSLQLKVTTTADTGLGGIDVGSIFAENVFGLGLGDHYVKWDQLAITVSGDINEKLDQILAGQKELKQGQEEIKQKIDEHDAEIKKLLQTPQGRRPGFPFRSTP